MTVTESSQHNPTSNALTENRIRLRGPARILVVRPDRLGDVILSTPVFEVIKRYYSKSHLTLMVKENLIPLLKGLDSVDECFIFDPEGRHSGIKGFFQLISDIRKAQYQIAIVLQSHWKIAAALFFAQVRFRVGPLSKFHSFLFYNRGVRQQRSHVEMHESDYNLQLLRRIGIRVGTRNVGTSVHVSDSVRNQAIEWLKAHRWNPAKPLILIHSGMGGSALNWPEVHYQELVRNLIREGHQILLTAGPTEGHLLDRMAEALGTERDQVIYYRGTPQQKVDFFAGIISQAHVVIAPSTGPLHLAVALGKRVVTFFPPIRVQSALRWGPYQVDESKASVMVPEIYCGEDFKCVGNLCNYFPCMKTITVKQALAETHKQIELSLPTATE